jgi:thiamine monophosphate synthase
VQEIAAAGAGVAVISAVAGAADPEAATRRLLRPLPPEASP